MDTHDGGDSRPDGRPSGEATVPHEREVSSPIRVLHVDDDPDVLDLAESMLARELPGAAVLTTTDPKEALAMAGEVDCLVSDLAMRPWDGLDLLDRVRKRHPDLPFVLYTSKGADEVASEALARGATDFVRKRPGRVGSELLANRIANAVAARRAASDADGRDDGEVSYREIFDRVNDAIFVHDIETGELVDVNRKACEMLGAPREEIRGLRVADFSAGEPYTQTEAVSRIRRAATEGPQRFEWLAEDAEGEAFWMEVNLKRAPVRGTDRVLAVVRDVTARRRREERLDSLHASTRELMRACSPQEIAAITVGAVEELLEGSIASARLEADDRPVVLSKRARERLGDPPADADGEWLRRRYVESGATVYENGIDGFGRLVVGSDAAGEWSETDLDLVEILAANATAALQGAEQEAKLRTERDRVNALFRNVSEAAVYVEYVDGVPVIREINPAFEEVFGYPAADVIGRSLDDVIVPPEYEAEARELTAELRDGAPLEREVRRRTASGPRDFLLRSTPLGLHGDRHGSFGLYLDVTEQKRREHTLEVLHEATRELMQAGTSGGIARITVETMEEVLDQPYAAFYLHEGTSGTLRPVAVTDGVTRLFDDPESTLTVEVGAGFVGDAFAAGGTRVHGDVRAADFVVAVDELRSVMAVPLGTEGVLAVGAPAVDAFDEFDVYFAELLTSNAEAALERARRIQLLREREAELVRERDQSEALFENVPDPAIRCAFVDDEPIVRTVNSAFEEVFGYRSEEVVGNSLDDYLVAPEREDEAAALNTMLQRGKSVHAEVRRETVEGVRDFLLHVVPYKTGERSVNGYAIYTDITERKAHETALTRQNERLAEFASIVSHDLRNPLNVAEGYLSLARETGDDAHLAKVSGAHDRMDRLIGDLLDLARQGLDIGEVESVDLAAVAGAAWRSVDTGNATLDVEDSTALDADPDRLRELLENLFRNAVEHGSIRDPAEPDADRESPADPETPGVVVRVGALESGFYVEDDGPGIAESDRERIFDSGYTTTVEGTGFGLAIVRRIAEGHGWRASATEGDDGGARFEIEF